jgi:hypothetical protein
MGSIGEWTRRAMKKRDYLAKAIVCEQRATKMPRAVAERHGRRSNIRTEEIVAVERAQGAVTFVDSVRSPSALPRM